MRPLARTLVALLLLGCGTVDGLRSDEGLDYDDVTGAWASIETLPSSAQFTVTSDSMLFFDRSPGGPDVALPPRGMRRVTYRDATTPAGAPDALQNAHFEFTLAGDEVRITYDCPLDADCAPGPHLRASIASGIMTVRPPMTSSVSPSRYTRVSTQRAASW